MKVTADQAYQVTICILAEQLVTTIVALRAAHDEESVCSCPFDKCVLFQPWAKSALRAIDAAS